MAQRIEPVGDRQTFDQILPYTGSYQRDMTSASIAQDGKAKAKVEAVEKYDVVN